MQVNIHRNATETGLNPRQIERLCRKVAAEIELQARSCSIIFVDDAKLSSIHAAYLNDPSPTDIITFDLGEEEMEGELYISLERAQAQAREYGVPVPEEIIRLIIHGLLHLKGYNDIEPAERKTMKEVENRLVRKYAAT